MARIALIVSLLTALLALFGFFQWAWAEWKAHRVRKKDMWFLLLSPLLWCIPIDAEADVLNAASCSYADVNSVVGTAISGDTVQIPVGTCDWAGNTLSPSSKSITIQGVASGSLVSGGAAIETVCNTGGQTTYTCIKHDGGFIIHWTTIGTGNPSISHIVFITSGSSGCSTYSVSAVRFSGTSTTARMHHNTIIHGGSCGGFIASEVFGVADHNRFLTHNNLLHSGIVRMSSYGAVGLHGDNSWAQASSEGGASNFFFEDNFFETDDIDILHTITDHFYGGRAVMRFNDVTDGWWGNHGTESGGRDRSAFQMEIYRNKHAWTITASPSVAGTRGGKTKLFDNKMTGTSSFVFDMSTDRASPGQPQTGYYPYGYCGQLAVTLTRSGTTATGTTASTHGTHSSGSYINISGASDSNFNGTAIIATRVNNTTFTYTVADTGSTSDSGTIVATYDENDDSTGYPCIDQVGRGTGDYLSGEGPGAGNNMSPKAPLNQALSPVYCWHNTINGTETNSSTGCVEAVGSSVMTENRDYYNYNASFTGATGIGRGERASRPATCTTGTAYWSTNGGGNWNTSTTETFSDTPGDDGGLDICTATDTWTDDAYVPYIYPHPLVTASESLTGQISAAVVGRVIRWMEFAALVTGLGWHFRKTILAVCVAVIAYSPVIGIETWTVSKQVTKQAALKGLTVFNHLTKPRD